MRKTFVFIVLTLSINLGLMSSLHADEWRNCKSTVLKHLHKIEGWCPPEKAEGMMNLIYETHPEVCVEIGVFGGASIFPTASALKFNNKGVVYAIDPWSNQECLVGYASDDPNYLWWNSVNLESILNSFKSILNRYDLNDHCTILRMTSEEAVLNFEDESIDIIHIDGNHSEDAALLDAKLFLPKLKSGAYIWFDDANWVSTHKAIAFLLEYCELDPSVPAESPFLLLKKR